MSDYAPDEATARADLCRFLSACYYEPAPEFAEENLFHSMLVAAASIHPDLADSARKLGEAFAAQDLQTLLVDYTRLFLGPMQALASPYGSSWLSAPVQTEENPPLAVLDLYSAGGFEIDEEFRELPDHVAVELEFLYLLIFNKNQASQAGNMDDLTLTELLQRRFLGEHLGVWMGPFAAAVKAGADTVFYRELAAFTERFVRMEAGALSVH
ncbi:TorD/DmsD family molecular chaperone [Rhodoferax ferrireducens]|uniref:TorD/DmsD family molecular chaperone n=1 Tax=Rhodoferax ferrireducens TaxID=192843 RepID=UPI003BB66001